MKELSIEEKNAVIAVYEGAKHFSREFMQSLTYHKNYDALMPVLSKVMAELQTIKRHNHIARLKFSLSECYKDITPLFEATVKAIQFINTVNQRRNETSI